MFLAESRAQAKASLVLLKKSADEEGVPCDTEVVVSDHPYEAIIRIAENRGCDLIMDGLAWPARRAGSAARQRNAKGAPRFAVDGVEKAHVNGSLR